MLILVYIKAYDTRDGEACQVLPNSIMSVKN